MSIGLLPPRFDSDVPHADVDTIAPRSVVGPTVPHHLTVTSTFVLDEATVRALRDGHITPFAFGIATYEDAFAHPHVTEFRYRGIRFADCDNTIMVMGPAGTRYNKAT